MDEADWFVDNSNRAKAYEVYNALLGSCRTRFPEHYKIIVITSPKSTESFAVRNMRQIANDGEKVNFWEENFEEENDIQQ